jgi:hypothetical protein
MGPALPQVTTADLIGSPRPGGYLLEQLATCGRIPGCIAWVPCGTGREHEASGYADNRVLHP